MNYLPVMDIIMIHRPEAMAPWQTGPFPVYGELPLPDGQTIPRQAYSKDFMEMIEKARDLYQKHNVRYIIGHKGSINREQSPGFYTDQRLIDESMFIITDLWDDDQLAILKMSIA